MLQHCYLLTVRHGAANTVTTSEGRGPALQEFSGSHDFAVMAIAVLALGIGASTAIFSVVNQVLLEPLPYPDPDSMVQLMTKSPTGDQSVVSVPKFVNWRDHTSVFQDMAAYDIGGLGINLTETEYPETLKAARVSADYFRLFGAQVGAAANSGNRNPDGSWSGAR